jgi:hypothetical protein
MGRTMPNGSCLFYIQTLIIINAGKDQISSGSWDLLCRSHRHNKWVIKL